MRRALRYFCVVIAVFFKGDCVAVLGADKLKIDGIIPGLLYVLQHACPSSASQMLEEAGVGGIIGCCLKVYLLGGCLRFRF